MDKEFATYEQALALKKLKFDEDCFKWYHNPDLLTDDELFLIYNNDNELFAFAPLKQQVFRWFREKKILGEIRPIDDWNNWGFLISERDFQSPFFISYSTDMDFKEYPTYEEAENACIDKLIEIAKQQDNG
jgi:hypothetical protein